MVKFKILLLLFLLLKIPSFFSQESMLSIDGTYLGKNLLVSNPPQADGFGFCVNKVTVNGEVLPATIQKANFEIDFSLFNLKCCIDTSRQTPKSFSNSTMYKRA